MRLDYLSKKPWSEPVKEVYIPVKAPNGEEVWLRQWRDSVNNHLQRKIIGRKIEVRLKDIQIQEEEIKKQLLWENSSPAEWTLEGFILILKNILQDEYSYLSNILESNNPQEEVTLYESNHPLVLFLELTPYLIERIFYNIDSVIPVSDREFLKDFVKRHNERDNVMLLKVIWDFE